MNERRLYTNLTLAGALPFVACALLPIAGIRTIPPFGDLHVLIGSYGLAIVSFLAGTHWAIQLTGPGRTPFNLFLASNVLFLVTWFAYLLLRLPWALLIQALVLLALLYIDYRLRELSVTRRDYFRTRTIATSAASASLALIFLTS